MLPESFEIRWVRQYRVNVVFIWYKGTVKICNYPKKDHKQCVRQTCKYASKYFDIDIPLFSMKLGRIFPKHIIMQFFFMKMNFVLL